jgi:hypothetical protein
MSIESSACPRAILTILGSTWDCYLEVSGLPKRTDSLPPFPWILKEFFKSLPLSRFKQ